MFRRLPFNILPQPDEVTCGPTCLHAVYHHFGDAIPLEQVIAEVPMLKGGGTLGALLACHALKRGYKATIYTYKLQLLDPTWLRSGGPDIRVKLQEQLACKDDPKLRDASRAYIEFLDLGGKLCFQDLNGSLLRSYLNRSLPVITGLSATYLYLTPREYGPKCEYDDVRGEPAGHFVVLCGYDKKARKVLVADPYLPNPLGKRQHYYAVTTDRVICAILLGVLTYDANLLIIEPPEPA